MSSFHTCSDKLELDEKLGSGPSTVGLPPSGNPERDLKSQWILLYLDQLLCLYINTVLGAARSTHSEKSHTWKITHTKKSLRVVLLKVWPEDSGDPQDSFRGFSRSFLNTYLCEAQFSSYTSTSKTYCNRFNVDADLRIWLSLLL